MMSHRILPISPFEPAHRKMSFGDLLKVIYENDVDGGTADGADHRHRACGDPVRHHDPEARNDFGNKAVDIIGPDNSAAPRSATKAAALPVIRVSRARAAK